MTPQSWVAGARNSHSYLITQPYVALLYFKTFFWPNGLSPDYDLNPLTTTDDPQEVSHCYELGCSVYITKPVSYDDFVEAIKRLGLFLCIVTAPPEDFEKE